MKLLIATSNKGKLAEFGRLLSDMPLELVGLDAFGEVPAPEENGSTFEDNAVLKAATYGRELGIISLADDSGLEVEALNGKPGVHSARYGGENLTDAQRTAFLLENMRNVPDGKRNARFKAVLACCHPSGNLKPLTAGGTAEGIITREPIGDTGFGYDPVFWSPPHSATFAMLHKAKKDLVSHRGRAIAKMKSDLRMIANGTFNWEAGSVSYSNDVEMGNSP